MMNNSSDYSSSIYHIYDQISDIAIINQQRQERKREQQAKKVRLIAISLCLLVIFTLILLVMYQTTSNLPVTSSDQQQQANLSPDAYIQQSQPMNPFQPPILINTRTDELRRGEQEQKAPYLSYAQQLCALNLGNCNQNGRCTSQGQCLCYPGFYGNQCELFGPRPTSLPILPQPQRLCAIALNNCHRNGHCTSQGKCQCFPGYLGESCRERDLCFEQDCSGRGICLPASGLCQCKFGFKGAKCELHDSEAIERILNCSSHGKFDYDQHKCKCDQGYSGLDCSEESCDLSAGGATDCGPNGLFDCRQAKCLCQDGYSGDRCQLQECSAQCLRNGRCENGACLCDEGFYGKHCSLNGCPNKCSGRGQCARVSDSNRLATATNQPISAALLSAPAPASSQTAQQQQQQQQQQEQQQLNQEWRCLCQPGAMGDDCSLQVERQCDDGIDNDGDGLIDCADSECCSDRACQNSTLCMRSPDPLDTLMRKQPSPPTSSFFQRMQFLIERSSSQIYSNLKDFNDSRASVVRGRVTYQKQGVTGVRVQVAGQINLGYTLTRDGGYFDLMVNGGGAVVIELRREPFATIQRAVRVPWNEIVLMDPIEMSLESAAAEQQPSATAAAASPLAEPEVPICSAHNYRLMRPVIVPAPKSSSRRHHHHQAAASRRSGHQSVSRAVILRDSAAIQQSITLPASTPEQRTGNGNDSTSGEPVSLVYLSSRANEFMSTLQIQLTPASSSNTEQQQQFKLPQDLKLVHLKIVVEGNLFEQIFEPQANLSFSYGWNRRNVYKQKSYGLSKASVSVGYEYFDCRQIIWTTRHVQLAGHELPISEVGNQWNLNIHHRYNYRDSVLQRGDGRNFNLRTDKPRVVQAVMGVEGERRETICNQCDGQTSPTEQRLLKAQALVAAPDGSLYVGDHNLIRKIERLPASKQQLLGGASDRIVRTVLELPTSRVPNKYSLAMNLLDQKLYMNDMDRNQIFLIRDQSSSSGSSKPQVYSQQQQPASMVELTTAANESSSSLALEDMLTPVVGNGLRCQPEDRGNCGDEQPARSARLIEPRALTFDLAGRMYIADGPNVRLVDLDNKIYTLLGNYARTRHTKFPCSGEAVPMHKFLPKAPLDLAMNPIDDTLHILDDNVVYKLTQDKRVQIVAGRLSHCLVEQQQQEQQGHKQPGKHPKATEVFLQSARSIAFSQNGELFIGESEPKLGINRVLLVSPEEDTISLYLGAPVGEHKDSHLAAAAESQLELQQQSRSSNVLARLSQQPTRATDYKLSSVSSMALDQRGRLIVADELLSRIVSVEPDLPQMNSLGEFELQSPDNSDELLVFNRNGYHVATREISPGQGQLRNPNKFTFGYDNNTPYARLASVSYSTGNKISLHREGSQHMVKLIETAFGGQCKLDITRNGQINSIAIISPSSSKTNFAYQVDGGLLKQSRSQATGDQFEFTYDDFGHATGIQHSSPSLPAPVDCRLANSRSAAPSGSYAAQFCSGLIVAE